jgi:methionyl-tRNA formyltransferase
MPGRLRIIFMGTPEFAVASLKSLITHKSNVVAVVTSPDRPAGRGQKLLSSPVKQYAIDNGIPVLQPEKLRNEDFLTDLRSLNADIQVVVAFRMLPEVVWRMPKYGTFNLHASLLPQYRGAAPINWAIIHGEKETGVTTFFIEKEIDTGKIIFQERETIDDDDDVGTLYERLMEKGAQLVARTVDAIEANNYPQTDQQEQADIRAAPKIFRETCEISWLQPAERVRNFIRGLSPYPAAWTTINNQNCKIFKSATVEINTEKQPGEYITDHKTYLYFQTSDGCVSVESLQLEGKKRMLIGDFLRGAKL